MGDSSHSKCPKYFRDATWTSVSFLGDFWNTWMNKSYGERCSWEIPPVVALFGSKFLGCISAGFSPPNSRHPHQWNFGRGWSQILLDGTITPSKRNLGKDQMRKQKYPQDCGFSAFELQWSVVAGTWQSAACAAVSMCHLVRLVRVAGLVSSVSSLGNDRLI